MTAAAARDPQIERARAWAILLVVAAHALMAYMRTPIAWALREAPGVLVFDGLVWIIHSFAMPVFCLLAGAAARQTLAAHGPLAFLRRRARRLVLPFALWVVPNSLLLAALWRHGAALQGAREVTADAAAIQHTADPISLGHLWFLYYLITYSALAAALWSWPLARRAVLACSWSRTGATLATAAPVALLLLFTQQTEITTPQRLWPSPQVWLFHALFFAAGFIARPAGPPGPARPAADGDGAQRAGLAAWRGREGWLLLAGSAALFAGLVPVLSARPAAMPAPASVATALLMSATSAGVLLVQPRAPAPRALQLLADRSYQLYLFHLPVVVALQLALLSLGWPALIKPALVTAATLALCLGALQLGSWPSRRWRRARSA